MIEYRLCSSDGKTRSNNINIWEQLLIFTNLAVSSKANLSYEVVESDTYHQSKKNQIDDLNKTYQGNQSKLASNGETIPRTSWKRRLLNEKKGS